MFLLQTHSKSALLLALGVSLFSPLLPLSAAATPGREPGSANPLLPGYFADPSILEHAGKFFIYATLDPWGGNTLGCWESPDFKQWTYRILNWPTKAACTSPQSGGAAVWAPSVVLGPDQKFHMFVSVGRQTCVDEIKFLPDGSIAKVVPTHTGPTLAQDRERKRLPATASASSEAGPLRAAGCVTDGNYATLWQPADPKQESWLQLDLGKSLAVSRQEIRFEYAWKPYHRHHPMMLHALLSALANLFFQPSGPTTGSCNVLHRKSNFLAVVSPASGSLSSSRFTKQENS